LRNLALKSSDFDMKEIKKVKNEYIKESSDELRGTI